MKEVIAYKAFFKGLVNNFDNISYEVGKTYETDSNIQWGRHGFHMCEEFEDCFFYLKPDKTEVELALVKGFGHLYSVDTGFKDYDDRNGIAYVSNKMEILKLFTHSEIIDMALNLSGHRLEKFIERFPLNKEEAILFKEVFKNETLYRSNETIADKIDDYQKIHGKVLTKRKEDYHG